MILIVAGSRDITDYKLLEHAFTLYPHTGIIKEIVSGKARGMDTLGEKWAFNHDIKISTFPADWKKDGKRAGLLRNCQMGDYADALLCCWNGSSGTKHMIGYMKKIGKPVFVCVVKDGIITGTRSYNDGITS